MSNESDRELLELAAKAAGLKTFWDDVACFMRLVESNGKTFSYWAPLYDDGDALRLAAKLSLVIHTDNCMVMQSHLDGSGPNDWIGGCDHDWYIGGGFDSEEEKPKFLRRAIVRAAAEIGRKKSDV